jgi:hypothetical protein
MSTDETKLLFLISALVTAWVLECQKKHLRWTVIAGDPLIPQGLKR